MVSHNPFARHAADHKTYLRFILQDDPDPTKVVLRNKLDLQTNQALEEAERDLVALRILKGYPDSVTSKSYIGYKNLHFHLFQDLFDWAGEIRPYPTGRNAAPYCVPDFIDKNMEELFTKLYDENYLIGLNAEDFAARTAFYVNELNAIHCFVDGNGRTGREWLCLLAENAGFEIEYEDEDRHRWNDAAEHGFNTVDESKFIELIRDRMILQGTER